MISIKYKYYFIVPKKKFKIISKNNNLKNLLSDTKSITNNNKKYYLDENIILLKLTKNKIDTTKSKLKLKTGPIKVEIIFYKISQRGAIKVDRKDDRTNLLFYTQKYLDKYKILQKDLQKIGKAAFKRKLETKLLAPKLIDQIKKIKL
jgi:hypothetical protein